MLLTRDGESALSNPVVFL